MPDRLVIIEDELLLASELERHYRRSGWDVARAVLIGPAHDIAPGVEDKREILQNAIDLAGALGIDVPRVAVLAPVETVTPRLPAARASPPRSPAARTPCWRPIPAAVTCSPRRSCTSPAP